MKESRLLTENESDGLDAQGLLEFQDTKSVKANNKEWVEWLETKQLKGEGSFHKTVLFQGDIDIRREDFEALKRGIS